MESPLNYFQLVERLVTDEMQIDRELLETPPLLQMASDEACRLGMIYDGLRVQLKALEADEKAAEGIIFLAARNAEGKKPTVDEAKATVDSSDEIIAIRRQILDVQRQIAQAKGQYDKWFNLYDNFKSKLKALLGYKDMICSGYVGYKNQ